MEERVKTLEELALEEEMENEGLDISCETTTSYEVWALGIDKLDSVTDTEILVGEFTDPEEAIKTAWLVDIPLLQNKYGKEFPVNLKQFQVEVETVVNNGSYSENIGTIFRTTLVV